MDVLSPLDQAERDSLQNQLQEVKRQQTLEVTKLLEHISAVETEKDVLLSKENERNLLASVESDLEKSLAQMTLEKEESKKKIIALDGAYKLLKDKHMRLVETHANLLRSNAAGMGELEKAKIASQASLDK